MFGTTRRPSAEELQGLVELTRRDPGSPAFAQLGEAYMALGRPRDAIEVGSRGLQANPNSIEGRLMVSRAFAMLHEWKQAQAELLKVVKIDRSNAPAFLLLGEVLMRRSDYERALPVLQHAQNLDPANPRLLDLLRRVRSGEPLEPPPPIPTPVSPTSGAGGARAAYGAPTTSGFEEEPTRVAGGIRGGGGGASPYEDYGAPAAAPAYQPPAAAPAYQPPPAAPAFSPPLPAPAYPTPAASAPAYQPPPAYSPPAAPQPGYGGSDVRQPAYTPAAAMPVVAAAPQPSHGGPPPNVRPRVLPAHKPKDAALASLRQSAAMGESYLNNLLTAGLLEVPNVRAPEADFENMRGKRWGRSTLRAFLFLFILMFASLGGTGYWYYRTQQQRAIDVARHLAAAQKRIELSTYEDLTAAVTETQQALERDPASAKAMAVNAKAGSLIALLYGVPPEAVDVAISGARRDIKPGEDGWRDIMIAQAASTLATLPTLEQPKARLADTRNEIGAWLSQNPDDHLMRWLEGVALQLAGERAAALAAFQKAEAGGKGPVVATISVADMMLDTGKAKEAGELYEAALKRSPNHPLALIGRALWRAETAGDSAATFDDLNVGLAKNNGPRVDAYKTLGFALANYVLEDYGQFSANLDKTGGVPEPRYVARVALGRMLEGKIKDAAELRGTQIAWYGNQDPEPEPLVTMLEAELLLADGMPAAALAKVEKLEGVRAQRLRGRALFDLGKHKESLAELDAALELAPEDLQAKVWHQAARMLAGSAKDQRAADEELDSLGRTSNSKLVRYAHGNALLKVGRTGDARRKLELSLEDISPEYPNPLAYRAHTALAELDLGEGNLAAAAEHLQKALEQAPAYLPANGLSGRVLLAKGEHAEAAAALKKVVDEPEAATAAIELAYAEALVSQRGKVSEAARKAAREAVVRAKDKGAAPEELARVAALVDPALVEELSLGGAAPSSGSKKKGGKKRRR